MEGFRPIRHGGRGLPGRDGQPGRGGLRSRRGSRDRGGPHDRAGLAGRMDLEGHAPMRAASVGQEDGGARYQQGHHDGKENPDCMPG